MHNSFVITKEIIGNIPERHIPLAIRDRNDKEKLYKPILSNPHKIAVKIKTYYRQSVDSSERITGW